MTGDIQAPIFVLFEGGELVAFEEVFEAELLPNDKLSLVETAWDAHGHRVLFTVKQQYALRLKLDDGRPYVEESRLALISALQAANDIDVEELPLAELVVRASAQFSAPKKVDWEEVNWTDGCRQGCASFPIMAFTGLTIVIATAVRSVLDVPAETPPPASPRARPAAP